MIYIIDSNAKNCQKSLKNINQYESRDNQRNIHIFGFFILRIVALIADVVSSCGCCIYPNSKVIKESAFHAIIQNAIIIAGKKGMTLSELYHKKDSA